MDNSKLSSPHVLYRVYEAWWRIKAIFQGELIHMFIHRVGKNIVFWSDDVNHYISTMHRYTNLENAQQLIYYSQDLLDEILLS